MAYYIMQLTKKERRALRREEKLNERLASKNGGIKKVFIWAVVILLIGGAAYWLVKGLGGSVKITEIGESLPDEGRNHVSEGTNVDYNSNPPTSGSHWGIPDNWGIVDHQIPDEAAVNNLEHGGIWISYRPGINPAALEKLKAIVKDMGGKILLTPRVENDNDVAAAAWGRYYKFDVGSDGSFDEAKVRDFIKLYINHGPENVPDSMPGKDY